MFSSLAHDDLHTYRLVAEHRVLFKTPERRSFGVTVDLHKPEAMQLLTSGCTLDDIAWLEAVSSMFRRAQFDHVWLKGTVTLRDSSGRVVNTMKP